jgi:hypothetical protein
MRNIPAATETARDTREDDVVLSLERDMDRILLLDVVGRSRPGRVDRLPEG